MIDDVLRHMAVAAHTDSEQLLRSLAPDVGEQLRWMPVMWHLVATRRIAVDWDVAFGRVVPLWAMESGHE